MEQNNTINKRAAFQIRFIKYAGFYPAGVFDFSIIELIYTTQLEYQF